MVKMLEDVLLIEEKHKNAAEEIITKFDIHMKDRYIIALSGESGSGKSELAHMIARNLKKHEILAKVIHTDNYYKIDPKIRTKWRKEHGVNKIGLDEYDWDALEKTIQDFKNGNKSHLPCVDLITDQIDELITDFNQIRVIILEGLFAINFPAEIRIYIDLTYHETRKAQKLRGKEPIDQFRYEVLEREHKVISKLKKTASIVINKDYRVE